MDELNALRDNFLSSKKTPCSKEDENKYCQMLKQGQSLPENIVVSKEYGMGNEVRYHFYVTEADVLSEADRLEFIMLKQLQILKTIKNCSLFFVALGLISIIISILL